LADGRQLAESPTPEKRRVRIFYNANGGFQSIGHTADGQVLTLDNHARLAGWDVAANQPDRLFTVSLVGYQSWAVLKGLRSTNGTVAVLAAGSFHRYNLAAKTELPPFIPGEGRVAELSEDGTLAVVIDPGTVRWRLWDVNSNAALPDHFELPHESPINFRYNPVLAPDNKTYVVSVATDGRMLLWNRGEPKARTLMWSRPGRHYPLLAFSPDARFLLAAQISRNGKVGIWDLPEGKLRWSLPQEVFVWAVAVHPSGNFVAVATVGGPTGRVVRFLDAATGAELKQFDWNAGGAKVGRVRCLAFSPDGLTCAAGCSDRRLVVWDVD